jgi:hypothetical protein
MKRSGRVAILFVTAVLTASAAVPIRLHPKNPHYVEFRGKAVALITSGEHYGAVFNGAFDYRRYLETLSADGLNYTRMFGGSYVEIPSGSFGIRRNDLAPEPDSSPHRGRVATPPRTRAVETSSIWSSGTLSFSTVIAISCPKPRSAASSWR